MTDGVALLPAKAGGGEMIGAWGVNSVNCVDALDLLRGLPDASVNLIATDPPYNGVKNVDWDNQWKTDRDYLDWLAAHLREFRRVLKPNGSLYLFASPQLAARVEVLTGEYFNVLNRITWRKPNAAGAEKGVNTLMSYAPQSEAIIFAQQLAPNGHSHMAQAIADHRTISGLSRAEIDVVCSPAKTQTGLCYRWEHDYSEGGCLPTEGQYRLIQHCLPTLTAEYEDLRRPFNVSADVPYTDVWDFPTVATYPGKHPCEKPLAMMRHIVTASSRPRDVVLDCFCGSGSTLAAAKLEGRNYIGCDREPKWVQAAQNRCASAFGERRRVVSDPLHALPMFEALPAEVA